MIWSDIRPGRLQTLPLTRAVLHCFRQMCVTEGFIENAEMSVQLQPGGQALGSSWHSMRLHRLMGEVAQVGATQLVQSASLLQLCPNPA